MQNGQRKNFFNRAPFVFVLVVIGLEGGVKKQLPIRTGVGGILFQDLKIVIRTAK